MARRARREGSSVETGARRDGRGTNVERGLDAREVRNVASRRGKPTDENAPNRRGRGVRFARRTHPLYAGAAA